VFFFLREILICDLADLALV